MIRQLLAESQTGSIAPTPKPQFIPEKIKNEVAKHDKLIY